MLFRLTRRLAFPSPQDCRTDKPPSVHPTFPSLRWIERSRPARGRAMHRPRRGRKSAQNRNASPSPRPRPPGPSTGPMATGGAGSVEKAAQSTIIPTPEPIAPNSGNASWAHPSPQSVCRVVAANSKRPSPMGAVRTAKLRSASREEPCARWIAGGTRANADAARMPSATPAPPVSVPTVARPSVSPATAAIRDHDLPAIPAPWRLLFVAAGQGGCEREARGEENGRKTGHLGWSTRAANERPHCRSRATSVAQARLVFSKLLDELPGLKMIIHHAGGMVPFFEGRIGPGWDQLGSRTSFTDYRKASPPRRRS